MSPFSVTKTIKSVPDFPYETIKNDILGKRYTLSLSFVGPTRAVKLNTQYRQKTYAPNVLSFPLSEDCGEIIICPAAAKPEAKKFNLTPGGYLAYLYIHGLLHLKGHDHHTETDAVAMEKLERRYIGKYSIV